MGNATRDAELQAFLLAGQTRQKSTLVVIAERSPQGVAHIVAEGADARQLCDVGLYGELLRGISTLSGAPALAIDIDRRVDGTHLSADGVHRLNVVHAHEVEAEAVDMVLVNPVFHALQHKVAHDRPLRCRLIAAS